MLFRSKEIYIAGLITSVANKVSKTGRPWVSFNVEDYGGNINFALFGKDYETFLPFMQEGHSLFIKAAIMPRIYGPKPEPGAEKDSKPAPVECELKIRKLTFLANIKDDFIKEFSINIPIKKINKEFRKGLIEQLNENKGKKMLTLKVLDYDNQMAVEFFSKKYKIDVNSNFTDFLDHNNLDYKLDMEISL